MQRQAWFEIHDHRLFPRFLRDLVTDGLEAMWNTQNTYAPILPLLRGALRETGAHRVMDLCSGGGGPWLRLSRELMESEKTSNNSVLEIYLTDLYPNRSAFRRLKLEAAVHFFPDPLDATRVPRQLHGFRTIFSAFHHFDPATAGAVLRDAFDARQGIAIFETATREPRSLAGVFLVPLLALLLAPRIHPFRWSRLFFTYLCPVVPFVLWFDGLLSCLRSYSQADFEELVSGMAAKDYRWEWGVERSGFVPVTYLIGRPLFLPASEMPEQAETTAV